MSTSMEQLDTSPAGPQDVHTPLHHGSDVLVYTPHETPGTVAAALQHLARSRVAQLLHARGMLLCALVVQTALTLRMNNSAFQDESLYIYAGHREIALLLHGTPTFDNYSSYFSGAPFLYPVLAGGLDGAGGLTAVRVLSLLLMLGVTALLYATTHRLINRQAAIFAAIVFAVAEPTQFLGHLATYDAPALFLLALAFWVVVRTAHRTVAAVLIAAPLLALATATKYAALLFVPTVIAVSVLAAVPHRGWLRAVLRGILLTVATAAFIGSGILLAPQLRAGITSTTSSRAVGGDSPVSVLTNSTLYIGGAFILAVIGTVLFKRHPPEGAPPSSARLRLMLGGVLSTTALLVPVNQMHLHTLTSLQKHVGYGLLFAAPLAGVALSHLLSVHNRDRRRVSLALATCLALTWGGINQAQARFHDWPNSSGLISALRTQVRPVTGRYLVEESEVPRYYLRDLTQPYQWTGTYYFAYTNRTGEHLLGVSAYRAAIAERYFDVIALRYGPTAALDVQIDGALRAQQGYQLIARIPADSSYGAAQWSIWRRT